MKTMEQLIAMYEALGESKRVATRHAKEAYALQNPEALMESYRKGSQIKVRQEAAKFNNMR
jgi:NACalpha-BTF3-like transcription factor